MISEIALITLVNEFGDEFVLEGYKDFDKANERVVDLITATGDPSYYVQYIKLY